MTKQEQLEKKVVDANAAKAAYVSHVAYAASYSAAANAAHVDAEAACVKAMNELEQYIKEQAND